MSSTILCDNGEVIAQPDAIGDTREDGLRVVDIQFRTDKLGDAWKTLQREGYTVELGPGNYWADAYHEVGRAIWTDAPAAAIRAAMRRGYIPANFRFAAPGENAAIDREFERQLLERFPD